MADDVTKAFKQASAVVQKATIATLNKSAAVAKTAFGKAIRESTGLQKAQVDTRLFLRRATYKDPVAAIAIGIRRGIDATYFKTSVSSVSIAKRGGPVKRNGRTYQRGDSSKPQNYQSISVDVGSGGSVPLPGAFIGLAKNSSRETIFVRLGSKRLKVTKIYLKVLKDAAIAAQADTKQLLLDHYSANIQKTLDYFLSKGKGITVLDDGDDGPA